MTKTETIKKQLQDAEHAYGSKYFCEKWCKKAMRKPAKNKHSSYFAFSLTELMAVVAIIGVLVTLAVPRFKVFIARARMAEAKNNLGIINKLQEAYWLEQEGLGSGKYAGISYGVGDCGIGAAKNVLGFRLSDCTNSARYLYTTYGSATTADRANSASTKPIYPNCQDNDEWDMSKSGYLKHSIDVVTLCQ